MQHQKGIDRDIVRDHFSTIPLAVIWGRRHLSLLNTRRRVLLIDKASTVAITVVGLSVIIAVVGMMLFLIGSSWPLFEGEKFVEAGRTHASSEPINAIVSDDVAPMLLSLPSLSPNCRITLSGVTNESPELKSNQFLQTLTLSRETSVDGFVANSWQLNKVQPASANQPSNSTKCKSIGHGLMIAQTAGQFSLLKISFGREFMSSEESRTIAPELRAQLAEQRWIVLQDETILIKPSQQSPSARLKAVADEVWTLPMEQLPAGTQLDDLVYIPHPNQNRGVITTGSQNAVRAFLFEAIENQFTGESELRLKELTSDTFLLSSEVLKNFPVSWIEDRYIVMKGNGDSLNVFDSESASTEQTQLYLNQEGLSFVSLTPAFGGAGALGELSAAPTVNDERVCVYYDIGKSIRSALATPDKRSPIDVIWQSKCTASVRTISHPTKRVVFRLLAQTNPQSVTLEARELTTGRVAAHTTLPATAIDSLAQDGHGHLLVLRDSNNSTQRIIEFHAPHIEVSAQSLFGKIKYESYESASYSWQSTSGTDEFQPKFSLIPLIWGTFKATLYSLLFAVPLAIFAAVYSSEILDRATRNIVKPTLEMMASVPSVVLGFLAAIVVAPWVEAHIVSVLLIGTLMPFLLYVFGIFLQVPSARHLTTRGLYASRRLLLWVIAGFAFMLWMTTRFGLFVEKTAFGGDLKAFLSGGPGTEGVLWGMLLLPLVLMSLWSLPVRKARNWFRVVVFLMGPALAIGIGGIIANQTQLRTDFFGQYAQRNTLVIAIAMGFAIIPIIYSLAEDALTSVPNALRAGSLACGASVWQTTAKVVLPTAASGLFSAIMVGLGRGIGETMIAVMATGNTAVMTTNPFDGLRSLAANIAVELPEAAQGSTHYRILFLSALALFLFTFTLNSFAELLRARYRARNKAL